MDPQAEQAIAHGLREGRTDAWQALYDAHARMVWQAVARQMAADSTAVPDVVQETFLAAARSAWQFDAARGSLWQWLCGIARRQVALHYRNRRRYEPAREDDNRPAVAGAAAVQWLEDGTPPPHDQAACRELAGLVQSALTRLPQDYEALLRAKYFDGVSVEDLAGQEQSTETAIRSRLARARQAFREVFCRRSPCQPAGW
jgi:RNA polymerase sigma-70 factor (ECF subfamily)